MKVALASCFDATEDAVQSVWTDVLANHHPDVLLLLGDSIYMDYWPHLGRPKRYTAQHFAEDMHRRYRCQWEVTSFRELVRSVQRVGVTWDDHDFAWNGACGLSSTIRCDWNSEDMAWECADSGTPQPYDGVVPDNKKRISHALFRQFRQVLQQDRMDDAYPAMPALADMLAQPAQGIEECFDLEGVRFILLDGRSFREPIIKASPTRMLGEAQQAWLRERVLAWDGLKLVGSGSTLARSGESWDNYTDLEWLLNQRFDRTLVLSGDIHRNSTKDHEFQGHVLWEFTSSGAARPGLGGATGNYGILDIVPDQVAATLFKHGNEVDGSALVSW